MWIRLDMIDSIRVKCADSLDESVVFYPFANSNSSKYDLSCPVTLVTNATLAIGTSTTCQHVRDDHTAPILLKTTGIVLNRILISSHGDQ